MFQWLAGAVEQCLAAKFERLARAVCLAKQYWLGWGNVYAMVKLLVGGLDSWIIYSTNNLAVGFR